MHLIDDLADDNHAAPPAAMRVLVVEDDEVERLRLATLLEQQRMSATCVGSVIEARLAMREGEFDAALIDVQLPDGSGMSLVPDLIGGEVPCACVVLTGSEDFGVVQKAVELGVTQFLRKPSSPVRVRQALHMALHRTRTLRDWLIQSSEAQSAQAGAVNGDLDGTSA